MEGVEEGPSQLEVQETRQGQDTQPPTTPQYEDVRQESDLESVASSNASQSKGKESFPGLWSRKEISSTAT